MLWLKSFHIIAMVCWFAALFYLPRLFVYHAMSEDAVSRDRFVVMESKLFWSIATPSAAAALLSGAWLLFDNPDYFLAQRWMQAKLGLVALLLVYHGMCRVYMGDLRDGGKERSHVFFRVFNELPVFLLAAIVILVVVKPVS